MDSLFLLLTLFVPLVTALTGLVQPDRLGYQKSVGIAGASVGFAAALCLLAQVDRDGFVVVAVGGWAPPFGIALVADRLSAVMAAVSAFMAVAVAVFAVRDVPGERLRRHFYPLFHFLIFGVQGAFLTGDLFNLFVWFEVMLLSSFVLLVLGNERPQLEGGLKYVVLNIVSSALFLSGVGILYGKLGTLNMADIAAKLLAEPDADLINSSGALLLASFGIKAGLFPLFFWLPASYHTPSVSVSAIFAGLLTKVGVYALIRTFTLLFSVNFGDFQELLIWVAAATMVTGVLGAAAHYEIRRILSFHIVSQIGYMLMGLAIMTPLALAAAIFYLVHHIIVKTNLFLVGGIVQAIKGTSALKEIGGLYRVAPGLALIFFVPAFSLGGIPPLSGFWAKLGVVRAGLEGGHWILVGVALAVGILTLFSMTKIWAEAFWKADPRPEAEAAPRAVAGLAWMLVPSAVLTTATLIIGLFGEPLFGFAERAAGQLLDPGSYIEAVLGTPHSAEIVSGSTAAPNSDPTFVK